MLVLIACRGGGVLALGCRTQVIINLKLLVLAALLMFLSELLEFARGALHVLHNDLRQSAALPTNTY